MVTNYCTARKAIFLESSHFGANHPNKGRIVGMKEYIGQNSAAAELPR